jgi:platelet-activating factor acetylhydrolase IB subunit alpha
MTSTLTDRQRKDLYAGICEYLLSEGDKFKKTIVAFKEEAEIVGDVDTTKQLLEKKWTSVVRLQKKVMELEAQIEELKKYKPSSNINNDGNDNNGIKKSNSDSRILPRAPAKAVLNGHRGPITCVTFHPIYSIIVSGSEDATIKIWDSESGQYERTLKGHTSSITGVAFHPLGNLLASSSGDLSAKLWDMETYTCTKTLKGHDHTISGIQFLPSGDQVLTCSRDKTIKAWEVTTGYCIRTYSGHSDWVKCLSISLDGQYFATGCADHNIMIWKMDGSNVQTLIGHEHVVETLSYGKKLKSAATIVESVLKNNNTTEDDDKAAFSYLASGSRDRTVKLWDPLKGQLLMTFNAHDNWVRCVIIHPSGKYILSCSDDKSIRVMDIKEGRCLKTIGDAHGHFVSTISLSTTRFALVSGSVDKNLCIWDCS